MGFLDRIFWGNSVADWIIAALIFFLALIGVRIIQNLLQDRLATLVEKTHTNLNELLLGLIKRVPFYFILALALFLSAQPLRLSSATSNLLDSMIFVVLILQTALWGMELIDYGVRKKIHADEEDPTAARAISMVAKIALWLIVVLLVLENVTGIEINSLLATLGVGGVAVALAVQNILGDLFSSLSISLDKPFAIGDSITVDDLSGEVESIGLKSTRLRSISGEQLVFSNSDLLSSRIHNFERMDRRRAAFQLGVACDTPYEKLAQIPSIIEEIVDQHENATFDRVHFTTFGDSTLIFDCVYQMEVPDLRAYLDTLHTINLEIYKRFEEHGIKMPYPTQTVLLEKQPK